MKTDDELREERADQAREACASIVRSVADMYDQALYDAKCGRQTPAPIRDVDLAAVLEMARFAAGSERGVG